MIFANFYKFSDVCEDFLASSGWNNVVYSLTYLLTVLIVAISCEIHQSVSNLANQVTVTNNSKTNFDYHND